MRSTLASGLASVQNLVRLIAQRFAQDRCAQIAGELTFTTLLALVPLLTIALTLVAAFPVFEEWSTAFKVFLLTTLVPEVGGKVITVYMQQFADNAARLTAIGLVFLAVTALMLMVSIERVFNVIWRARRPRSVVQRLVVYWTTITTGPLLIGASISLTSWLVAESISSVGGGKEVHNVLLRLAPVVLNGAAFALIYLTIPNRRVRVNDALAGGAAAAVVFEAMKRGFALYVELFPTYSLIYGTFATIPVFLLWIYLSWLVVLFGAVVVAILPRWRLGIGRDDTRSDAGLFRALRLIELLHAARQRAETPSVPALAMLSGLLEETVESALEAMERAGWVRRVEPAGWVLARDLATLRLAEVFRTFALDLGARDVGNGPLVQGADGLLRALYKDLEVPLEVLIEQPPALPGDERPPGRSGAEAAES
ncbi:MAG: YihY family inner membrane protein [Betaproteobacteria bacterium]|nr:MAG: YihY family inner membrane protein [Betaproteobacteria bacterium]